MKNQILQLLFERIKKEYPNYSIQEPHRELLINFDANENTGRLLQFIDNEITEAYLKFGLNMFVLEITYLIQYNEEHCSLLVTLDDSENF